MAVVCICAVSPPILAQWPNAEPAYQTGFPVEITGAAHVRSSAISLGDIDGDGSPEIVVGTSDGVVVAFDGNATEIWRYPLSGSLNTGFEGKAAIADIDGDDKPEIVIGAGSTISNGGNGDGVLLILSDTGELQCQFIPRDTSDNGHPDGIFSSPAIGNLEDDPNNNLEIAFGGWDSYVYVIRSDCSLYWEKFVRDSIWSSPALADLDRDGQLEIVIGVDAHWEPQPIGTEDGGILHAYLRDGSAELPGFPIQIDEVIWSSATIGDVSGDGLPDIISGTGRCWDSLPCAPTTPHPGVGEYINAWNHLGNHLDGWPFQTPGEYAFASPALADIDEDGIDEVVINTINKSTGEGRVYVLNGDGTLVPGWPRQPSTPATCSSLIHLGTPGSPVVSDLNGDGHLEVALVSNWEIVVFDRFGNQLSRDGACPDPPGDFVLATNFTLSSTPAIGDIDGDGDVEMIIGGGADATGSRGGIFAWDFPGGGGLGLVPWPQFRRTDDNRASVNFLFVDGFETDSLSRWHSSAP